MRFPRLESRLYLTDQPRSQNRSLFCINRNTSAFRYRSRLDLARWAFELAPKIRLVRTWYCNIISLQSVEQRGDHQPL